MQSLMASQNLAQATRIYNSRTEPTHYTAHSQHNLDISATPQGGPPINWRNQANSCLGDCIPEQIIAPMRFIITDKGQTDAIASSRMPEKVQMAMEILNHTREQRKMLYFWSF